MTKSVFLLVSFLMISGASETPESTVDSAEQLLKKVDQKYLSAKTITMKVKKIDTLAALDQKKTSEGEIYLKKGQFRLELLAQDEDKEKMLIVVDGKTLWQVQIPSEKIKQAKTQVVKMNLSSKKKKPHELLRVLTEVGVLKYFKVLKSTEKNESVIYTLSPQKDNKELQKIEMTIDPKEQTIAKIKYSDALENETEYEFSQVKFDVKVAASVFGYTPPKGASVTTY